MNDAVIESFGVLDRTLGFFLVKNGPLRFSSCSQRTCCTLIRQSTPLDETKTLTKRELELLSDRPVSDRDYQEYLSAKPTYGYKIDKPSIRIPNTLELNGKILTHKPEPPEPKDESCNIQ